MHAPALQTWVRPTGTVGRARMAHLPTAAFIRAWPEFTLARPLRVLARGCLAGRSCGVDGSTNGEHPTAAALLALPNVCVVDFRPEDDAFGTPRATPNIHGGDGFDVRPLRTSPFTPR